MLAVLIQTDLLSLLGLALGCLAFGVAATWLLMRKGRVSGGSVESHEKEDLYLVFSRLSHRLKTVGEVIRGQLHGFSDELPRDPERWRVARRAISEEATEIYSLTERLDLVVRLGMAGQPLVMEPVNVPRLLEDLMVALGPAADAKGIMLGGIVSEPERGLPYISADRMALTEVFSNLIENAVKHNGPGTEITAAVKHRNNQLTVRIADTGQGIAPEILAGIFEKGSRAYRPGAVGGTGMGLHLCKLLIELHSGDISVTSTNGQGTEFRITLPLRRAG